MKEMYTLLEPGIHSFPFEVEIPLLSSSEDKKDSASILEDSVLPPSFNLISSSVTASATYRIRAVVERSKFLKRNISTSRDLELRPLQPPDLSVNPEEPRYVRLVDRIVGSAFGLRSGDANDGSGLPSYCPSLTFEVRLPQSRTIHCGDHLNLQISFHVPKEIQQVLGNIWLRNIAVQIKTTTTVAVGGRTRSHSTLLSVCNVEGFLALESESEGEIFALSQELWKHHVCPMMDPSFQITNVRRTHRLEVLTSLMSRRLSQAHVRY